MANRRKDDELNTNRYGSGRAGITSGDTTYSREAYATSPVNPANQAGRRGADHNEDLHPELATPVENPSQPIAVIPGQTVIGQGAETAYSQAADQAINKALGYNAPAAAENTPKVSQDYLNEYLNRGPFKYDVNSDALYQQYKNQYMRQGNLAMRDTIGQASALTGGYGNSYAESAGQAAYNQYLGALNDKIPELYQLAYDRYDREGQQLRDAYELLYGRERDAVADEQWSQEFNLKRDQFDWSKIVDQHSMDLADKQFEENKEEFWATHDLNVKMYELDKYCREQGIQLQWEDLKLAARAQSFSQAMETAKFNYQKESDKADLDYKYAALAQNDTQFYANLGYKATSDANDLAYKYAALYAKTDNTKTSGSNTTDEDTEALFAKTDFKKLGYKSYDDMMKGITQLMGKAGIGAGGALDVDAANDALIDWLNKHKPMLTTAQRDALWMTLQLDSSAGKNASGGFPSIYTSYK